MSIISIILIIFVALLHTYFLFLEMFLWTKPLGLKVFKMKLEDAESKKVLAQNQGLYNGFLVAGLIWALIHPNPLFRIQIAVFFLGCVIVAGIFGGITVNKRIFFIQSIPAILGLVSLSY